MSSCTNPGISTPITNLIQPKFMVPLDLHVNDKTYNLTPLNGTCYVELKSCYKGIQGDTFQVQFCPDIFALICELSDICPEQNGDTSVNIIKRILDLSEKSEAESRQELENQRIVYANAMVKLLENHTVHGNSLRKRTRHHLSRSTPEAQVQRQFA